MNAKRWMALFLALTLAITMLAGCTKKTETPVADPEQGQMEPEPEQETQNQTQPVTPQQPEQEEKPQPEEPTPNEPQDEQQPVQEPELLPQVPPFSFLFLQSHGLPCSSVQLPR